MNRLRMGLAVSDAGSHGGEKLTTRFARITVKNGRRWMPTLHCVCNYGSPDGSVRGRRGKDNMNTFIFVWVLAMPGHQAHYFDTFKGCNDFRQDQKATYGMIVPRCHKEIYNPDWSFKMPESWDGGPIDMPMQWGKAEPSK
jgi:hypothetical protein